MGRDALITIEIEEDYVDCEDCGPSLYVNMRILKDGNLVASYTYDGHFGDGEDIEDEDGKIKYILKALGYNNVEVEYL